MCHVDKVVRYTFHFERNLLTLRMALHPVGLIRGAFERLYEWIGQNK